jgi:putative ABC transport system substrate-binding protein
MRRREFIGVLGMAAASLPLTSWAKDMAKDIAKDIPLIGFLCSGSPKADAPRVQAVRQGLAETGYVEGTTVAIEYRWAEGQYDRLNALAADLVANRVSLIVAVGTTPAAMAAKAQASAIPIVFIIGGDPVKFGFVESLNRPGGNLTGVSFMNRVIVAKQLEILHETIPGAGGIGFLVNPNNPYIDEDIEQAHTAAKALGVKLAIVKAATEDDLEAAFTTFVVQQVASVLVAGDLVFNTLRDHIVALGASHGMPVLYPWREAPADGGLMSYGADIRDAFRQGGIYAGKILKGEKPAELPVQQTVKIELVVNLKTAKTLHIDIPLALLARADEVIE